LKGTRRKQEKKVANTVPNKEGRKRIRLGGKKGGDPPRVLPNKKTPPFQEKKPKNHFKGGGWEKDCTSSGHRCPIALQGEEWTSGEHPPVQKGERKFQ